ncbi:copper homeostasis periplasmic binding protein CopC [Pseudomonas oryzihabitans]|uniref:copper homeostasis periplasmic binding protein CopC n=1 Tax=Pseudomonas oryzihabitans TaxID=47885 RepID=UPI00135D0F4E|nr:copper homeostasis periplasmic binding protein CopC [Pseudomonas oryzihabitans]MXS20545.1 copper homeostasis periplasmic binding protein CopC [Pseudomonas oryzihabitans]
MTAVLRLARRLTLTALLLPGLALAHGHLKSAEPAPDSTSPAPKQLSLSFSEGIEAALSQVQLQRLDGQAGTAITTGKVISGRDERTLDVPLEAPLEPGRYQVKWRVLAKDGHKTQGDYRFTVQ